MAHSWFITSWLDPSKADKKKIEPVAIEVLNHSSAPATEQKC